MARVTVEDCIQNVENRFELVLLASKRAKDLELGDKPTVPRNNDKTTIIALREIAEETVSLSGLMSIAKRALAEDEKHKIVDWQTSRLNSSLEKELSAEDFAADDEEEDDAAELLDNDTLVDSALGE
ncbi:hypothetical protein FACS1894113_1410 [Alphaproteobacteria bacterium]|nr:hypothetical protein FACS1894113_1410 [Alphaproteobacteria bacterium]